MTFEQWYKGFIEEKQPWCDGKDYREAPMYNVYQKIWEDAWLDGFEHGSYMEGLEEGIEIGRFSHDV